MSEAHKRTAEGLFRVTVALLLPSGCSRHAHSSTDSSASPVVTASDWTGARDLPRAAADDDADPDGSKNISQSWVLHVGDSFVTASFAQNLDARFREAGARQVVLAKTSTNTMTWAKDPDLAFWLARGPSLVVVTLGANEVDNLIPKLHASAIQAISRKVGVVAPCVWVAPPMWKADTNGWLQVLHDNCAPCLFFDSDAVLGGLVDCERRSDSIHPNERGGRRWADAFADWLDDHRDFARGALRSWALVPFEKR
jgi:lysophospholipase L1-like esterase